MRFHSLTVAILWRRSLVNCCDQVGHAQTVKEECSFHSYFAEYISKNNYAKFPLLNLMNSPCFLAPFFQWRINCITQKVDNREHWINFRNILWGQNFAWAQGNEQPERWHESRLVPVTGFNTASCKGKYCPRQQQITWQVCWNPNFFPVFMRRAPEAWGTSPGAVGI